MEISFALISIDWFQFGPANEDDDHARLFARLLVSLCSTSASASTSAAAASFALSQSGLAVNSGHSSEQIGADDESVRAARELWNN